MPKRPAKKVKGAVTEKAKSPSQIRREAKHQAQLEREAINNDRQSSPWEAARIKRGIKRKPLQEAHAKRMEKASNYKSRGRSRLTAEERANNSRAITKLVESYTGEKAFTVKETAQ